MDFLKFGALFTVSGVETLSENLGRVGEMFESLGRSAFEAADHVGEMGERLTRFGERLSVSTALMSEGAERMHEWSDAVTEPAKAMERSMSTLAAMTDINGAALDSLKERAIAFSNTHPGATAEQWVAGFTQMRGVYQDTARAMDAADVAGELARFNVDSEAAARLMTVSNANLNASARQTGDEFFAMAKTFGVMPQAAGMAAMAIGRLGPAASATHTGIAELYSLVGEANMQMGGGRGMTMFASMLNELVTAWGQGKTSGIDFTHGLTAGLRDLERQLAGMSTADKLNALKEMGMSSNAPEMLKLLDNLDEMTKREKAVADSAGALDKAYGVATDNVIDKTAQLHQNLDSLYDAMSSPALPFFSRAIQSLTGFVQGASDATAHHSAITSTAVITISGLGTTALAGVHAMSALGAASIFAGQGLQALDKIGAFSALKWMASGALTFAATGLKLLTGSTWGLDAAMDANPIGAVVIAITALAFAAYELYEHWGAITKYFEAHPWLRKLAEGILALAFPVVAAVKLIYDHWNQIKAIFTGAWDWMKTAGWKLVKMLGDGMLSAAEYPFKAAWHIASKILDHFPHSPAKTGPLADLHRLTISETIAGTMRPAPVIRAATRVAAAVAVAAPLMTGAAIASPGASAGIVIHAPLTINGAMLDEKAMLRVVERHAYELARILDREKTRKERTSF